MNFNENKKKILIVISGDLFIRNYLLTNAFSLLEENFECHYIANDETTIREPLELKSNFKGYYQIDSTMKKIHQNIFDLLMLKFQERSSSFKFRIMRTTPSLQLVFTGLKRRAPLRFLRWIFLKPFILFKRLAFKVPIIFNSYLSFLKNNLIINKDLYKYVNEYPFDLVIFPSSAYGPDGIDLSIICNQSSIKTLYLIDNWDNLSSKSILWEQPYHLGVWSEQSKQHAIEIQGMDSQKVSLLGTPRFENYFDTRFKLLDSHFDFKYVLFAGTALNFNEEKILAYIDAVIEKNLDLFGDLKVIYRPHPWRQNNCEVHDSYGKNIITDPQILSANNDKTTRTQPNLDYYPSLLQNAEYVMGGLTSMLIESLIFYKQFLVFIHEDDEYISNMRNAWNYFVHFQDLDKVEAIELSLSFHDIEKSMIHCWNNRDKMKKDLIDQDRSWYLFHNGENYQKRILGLTKKII